MSFGNLKGTLSGSSTKPSGGISTTPGSIAVSVGDLIVVNYGSRQVLASLVFTDNLGNIYSLLNAGVAAQNGKINPAYARVINAGTLTTVAASHASTNNDVALCVGVFEGPAVVNPLDVNATPNTNSSTPFNCPATGVLAQANELIVGFHTMGNAAPAASYGSTTPTALVVAANSATGSNSISAAMCYCVVASPASITPIITTTAQVFAASNGTASFKSGFSTTDQPGSVTFAGNGSFSPPANLDAKAITTFAGSGSFSVAANLAAQSIATFAGAGNFSATAGLIKPAIISFAGAGSFSADTFNDKVAFLSAVITGSFSASVLIGNAAFLTASVAGSFSANAFNNKTASLTFAGDSSFIPYANLAEQASITFVNTASLSADTSNDKPALSTFAGAGSFAATVGIGNSAVVTFNSAAALSLNTISRQVAATTFAGNGAFIPFLDTQFAHDYVGIITFAGAGTLSATANLRAVAGLSVAGAGTLLANAINNKPASLTAAVTGSFSANTNNSKAAFLTAAVTGSLRANAFNAKAASLTAAGTGAFLANAAPARQAVVTFEGAGVFSANTRMRQVASVSFAVTGLLAAIPFPATIWQARITFAGTGSFVTAAGVTVDATGELALIGNHTVIPDLVPCDVATKNTRYVYIGFNRIIEGKPALNFRSQHSVESSVNYPAAHIGTELVLTCRGLFEPHTYIKSPVDITTLLTSAGIWSVSISTQGNRELFVPDAKTQRFYMSVED